MSRKIVLVLLRNAAEQMQRAEHVIDGCWGQTDRQTDR